LRGTPEAGRTTEEDEAEPAVDSNPLRKIWPRLRWLLLAADVLFMILVSLMVFNIPRPLNIIEWLLCALALALGAALACLAVQRK